MSEWLIIYHLLRMFLALLSINQELTIPEILILEILYHAIWNSPHVMCVNLLLKRVVPAHKKFSTSLVGAAFTVADIDSGALSIPFTQTSGWKNIQEADSTLSKLKLHKGGGTIPVRKIRGSSELKKLYTLFLQGKITLDSKGLVVYSLRDSVGNINNLTVVPESILRGLVMALHIKCKCPSRKELENIMIRYWFSIHLAKTIQDVWEKCDICQSLKQAPREIFEQSSTLSGALGTRWAADIIKSDKQ